MILRQFLHRNPVGISYLFGCGGQSAGAVVDPVGDIEPYLRSAEEAGLRILFVVDTHLHADHLSAGRALAAAAGAEYVLSARANVSFPFKAAHDNDVLSSAMLQSACCTRLDTRPSTFRSSSATAREPRSPGSCSPAMR